MAGFETSREARRRVPGVRLTALLLLAGAAASAGAAGPVLYVTEGNNLRRLALRAGARDEIWIRHASRDEGGPTAADGRRDVNGMVCFLPDGSGRFVAGEDTGQPSPPPGWGIFGPDGRQVGKLTATYRAEQGEPHGCAFAPDGRLFTTSVGNQGFGSPLGQLILWFPPYEGYPGGYPSDAASTSFCKIATDIGTAGGVAIDDEGNVYVASAGRAAIYRFRPPFPTGPDPAGGCGAVDETGAPQATAVQREVFFRGLYTFSGLAFAPGGHLYAASVFTGEILEIAPDGRLVRKLLDPPGLLPPFDTGTPMGLAVGPDGALYYADLDVVVSLGGVGPGPDGKVRRIRFDERGEPLPPETLLHGLAFPDGLGIR